MPPASPSASRARTLVPWAARFLLVPYGVFLFLVTWLPGSDAERVTGIVAATARALEALSVPFEVGYPVLEFLANVALFMPLGFLVHLAWPRVPWWVVTAIGCGTSTLIELVQLALPSRFSTVSDVIANTLGAALGFVVARLLARSVVAVRRHRR